MKLKDKIKSYSFWISLGSAVILILKIIGSKFGFTIDSTFASDLLTSLCSILVITGIIVTPNPTAKADLITSQINEINAQPTTVEKIVCEPDVGEIVTQPQELFDDTNQDETIFQPDKNEQKTESEIIVEPESCQIEKLKCVEVLKNEIVNHCENTFFGKVIPTNPTEIEEFFNIEKSKFIEDLDLYINQLKEKHLSNKE